jgi:hypothetical protein
LKYSLFDELKFEELIQSSNFKQQLSTRMLFAGLLAASAPNIESEQRG